MLRSLRLSLPIGITLMLPLLGAGEPPGEVHRDRVEGFSVLVPVGWRQIPTQPLLKTLVAIFLGSNDAGPPPRLEVHRWGLDPDTRGSGPPLDWDSAEPVEYPNFSDWYDGFRHGFYDRFEVEEDAQLASEDGWIGRLIEARVKSTHYLIGHFRSGGREFGITFRCDDRDWERSRAVLIASIRSFRFLSESEVGSAPEVRVRTFQGTESERNRRIEARKGLPKNWLALDSENYVFLSDADPDLVEKIALRIEAIREQLYEVIFPPDRPIAAISVVRVCSDRDTYLAYGGLPDSAGYWNAEAQELVFYEDRNNRKNSFAVLYHEAFHQYIYHSIGDFTPHSWFNEGHGDYFSGARYKDGQFSIGVFQWRYPIFKTMIARGESFPLEQFLRMSQKEYYIDMGRSYPQGWALVYFLRKKTRNQAWRRILPTYFDTLKFAVANVRAGRSPDGRVARMPHHLEGWGGMAPFAGLLDPTRPENRRAEKTPRAALDHALEVAFDGIDIKKLERMFLKTM